MGIRRWWYPVEIGDIIHSITQALQALQVLQP
jgi:hypothetical protein